MLTKLFQAIQGRKTYILSALGVVVAVTGHFWGPLNVAGQTIPQLSSQEMWKLIWNSGLFAALRYGVGGPA